MPQPSRWGVATRALNLSTPEWIYACVSDVKKTRDFPTVSTAALELLVEKLLEEGYEPPDDLTSPVMQAKKKGRK